MYLCICVFVYLFMCVCVYLCICLFVFVQSLYAMHCTEVDRVGQDAPSGLFVAVNRTDRRGQWQLQEVGSLAF